MRSDTRFIETRDLTFQPMARPVRVTGRASFVDQFVEGLQGTLKGWPDGPPTDGAPFCTVSADQDGYTVTSDYLDSPLPDLALASAVCSVIADIIEAYLDANQGTRALHCGAFRFGGRMVLLAGVGYAGKSTLVTRLSMEPGLEVFCDDVLPIRMDGTAVALGVPPRVRLPLPPKAGAAFEDFVKRQAGLLDHKCSYVTGPSILPHGSEDRPDALLLLRRQTGAAPQLHALSSQEAAAAMLAQDMSLQSDGVAHIERITAMADAMFCATLIYDDLDAAVELLCQTFSVPDLGTVALQDPLPQAPSQSGPVLPADMTAQWRRNSDVGLRSRQGVAFLWDPPTGRYFQLNSVALACWTLIETPATGDDLAHELTVLFSDAPAEQVRDDVASWLGDMAHNGLVREVSAN